MLRPRKATDAMGPIISNNPNALETHAHEGSFALGESLHVPARCFSLKPHGSAGYTFIK